jgi:FKBP-type peptidyl-prolyl cis-trans isomerase
MRRASCIALVVGLAPLLACVGCKRQEAKVPTMMKAPPATAPTSQTAHDEDRRKLRESLDPVPELGVGLISKTPDGEYWTAYPSGLMIHELRQGTGIQPRWGQMLKITYVGTFPGQSKPFEERSADNPWTFALGSREVIKGLNMGVSTMKVGGKRRIFVPPDLGYGVVGLPGKIGMNQALIFEVELLDANGEGFEQPATKPESVEPAPLGPPAPVTIPWPASVPATGPGN